MYARYVDHLQVEGAKRRLHAEFDRWTSFWTEIEKSAAQALAARQARESQDAIRNAYFQSLRAEIEAISSIPERVSRCLAGVREFQEAGRNDLAAQIIRDTYDACSHGALITDIEALLVEAANACGDHAFANWVLSVRVDSVRKDMSALTLIAEKIHRCTTVARYLKEAGRADLAARLIRDVHSDYSPATKKAEIENLLVTAANDCGDHEFSTRVLSARANVESASRREIRSRLGFYLKAGLVLFWPYILCAIFVWLLKSQGHGLVFEDWPTGTLLIPLVNLFSLFAFFITVLFKVPGLLWGLSAISVFILVPVVVFVKWRE